jgi:segregation and condensation protein B
MEATRMNQIAQTSDALSESAAVEETTDANTIPQVEPSPQSTEQLIPEELGEFGDAADTSIAEVIDTAEAKRALEAALLAASEPMGLNELRRLFEGQLGPDVIRNLLEELRTEWDERSVELAVVASGYRFRVKPVYQKYLERLSSDKPLKYSRAVMETLAIIAYRQPVTRGDIEDIRGVAVSPHILKTLEDRGWIDEIGNRDTVGRPALFATTKHFLDDLNLRSLEELPPLHELQATLDMTQAGAALVASESPYLSLPGVDGTGQSHEPVELTDGQLGNEAETVAVDAEPTHVVEGDSEHQS